MYSWEKRYRESLREVLNFMYKHIHEPTHYHRIYLARLERDHGLPVGLLNRIRDGLEPHWVRDELGDKLELARTIIKEAHAKYRS